MKDINSYIIEDFANKVYAAKKTNQKQVVLDIKEANLLVENLTIILARALGNVEKAPSNASSTQEQSTSVSMDGGSW